MKRRATALMPRLVTARPDGAIRDDSHLLLAAARGGEVFMPAPGDLIPLPPESELFLLPQRRPMGFNPDSGALETGPGLAVAAFASPGVAISAHPAYLAEADAPPLPYFAYGAVGYARGRYWICGVSVDNDPRQRFAHIPAGKIANNCDSLIRAYPRNRLVAHIINNCARHYSCPAARNFALGRYEAPLPTSRQCAARCLGCISASQQGAPTPVTPQCRLDFTPTAEEIVEVMTIHEAREKDMPIYSFGQGCEGDPLANAELLAESVAAFRARGGRGTINCNTNASRPEAVAMLARAGLTSMRASLNSARPEVYMAYYRPVNYSFEDVRQSLALARARGVFTSLNLLYFPGITDTVEELEALSALCRDTGVGMIQWRNLNIDPAWFYKRMREVVGEVFSAPLGLAAFMTALKSRCPWLRYGYFNPWLGERAEIISPAPRI